ncbi:MAG: phage/plasmid primase, P4 family, partial [Candidatus Nanohaloarchaea archaeon]
MTELFNKFEERFEEIGAEEVFHHLMLGNANEFVEAKEAFDGDEERLDRLINSVEVFREEEQSGDWEEVIRDFEDSNTNKIEALKHTANLLREKYHFRTLADSGELYVFTNPAYEPRGEQVVKEELEDNLQDYLRTRDVREIMESIRAKTFIDRPQNAAHTEYVPLQNGWYNLEEDRLEAPDPDKFIAHELPIQYQEDADCPRIREFLHEVVEDENVPVLQELIGYCLYRDYPINKAFMLLGDGKNGKSTFLNLLKAFLGEENVATPSLHTLAENRFAKADLYGKLANIHADLSAQKLYSTGVFKMLTG